MGGPAIPALARLTERRFQSFSEAADAVLDLLEGALPADSILIGQLDWGEGLFRILDARGRTQGVQTGAALPLVADGQAGGGLLDPTALAALGVRSYLAIPFETHDGGGAITLCALGTDANRFTSEHVDVLTIAGRMLTYEWETVRWRAELRRMSEQLRDPESTDPVTGLSDATSFSHALEREWTLAQRGSIESYVVVCRAVDLDAAAAQGGDALARLLLKDMADVLGAAIRRTDHIGRTGSDEIACVLVGCKGRAGVDAFIARFQDSFAHVTSGRPATLSVSYGVRNLADCDSGGDGLRAARVGTTEVPLAGAVEEPVSVTAEAPSIGSAEELP
jgi:GGDEF domain-containing protein